MAWQRVLCVILSTAALAAVLQVGGAVAGETPSSTIAAEPAPVKKQVGKVKAANAHHRLKSKAAARKVKTSPFKATKAATPVHAGMKKTGQVGYASWYGAERHGKATAGGARFDKNELTAAHRTLPLDSKARVTNMTNGRSVTVRITDRGPSGKRRIIDLSQSAAEQLGMRHSGVERVNVEPLITGVMQ